MGSGDGSVYADLILTWKVEIIFDWPSAQEEAYQSSLGIVIIVYGKYTTTPEVFKQNHQLAEHNNWKKEQWKKKLRA